MGNDSRNVSNRFSSLVTLVDGSTCVTLALEMSFPDAARSDREYRLSLRSSAQVCDWIVRLLIGISTTAKKGPVRYRTPASLFAERDSRYGLENLSSSCSSEANSLPAVAWDVGASGDCSPPKSNAATLAHFVVTSWTSLGRLHLTSK